MDEVKSDSTATIEVAPEDTKIDSDIFAEAKEKNVNLELELENGVVWEIAANSITGNPADVNINVELETTNIPEATVEAVAEGKSTMQISLAHSGRFGFTARISIPVPSSQNGKVANLFYYNNGRLEFVASATVSGGVAKLPFTHASEYVLIFDEKAMGVNPTTGASEGTSAGVALIAVSVAAVMLFRKNKRG